MFRKNKRLRQKNKKNLVKNKNAKKPPQKDSLCARALFRSLSLRYVQHWVQGVPIPVADGNRGVACASAAASTRCALHAAPAETRHTCRRLTVTEVSYVLPTRVSENTARENI